MATNDSTANLEADPLWYKDAVIYEAHVRALADSDDDGMGDFRGLTKNLDYLRDLGVTAIWLLPFFPSPWRDDGYDISNYIDVHPAYGTLRDFQTFLKQAHRRGIRVIGHLQSTTWTEAARMGIDFIAHAAPWAPEYLPPAARPAYQPSMFGRIYWLEHLDLNSPAVQEMIATLVEHHVSVDPTLMAFRTKFWGDDPRYTDNPRRAATPPKLWAGFARRSNTADWTPGQYRAARAQWPKLPALVKLMYDRGVLLTAGTDTPFPWIVPGVSFHEELRLLAEAGIPAAAVVRMATINAGLALKQNIGSVEPGKEADLVVLAANPLESVQNTERIEIVIKAGHVYSSWNKSP